MVVMVTPGRQLATRLFERRQPLHIEEFVPQPAVKAFDKPILHRPAGTDEDQLYAVLDGPGFQHAASKLAAVVTGNALRRCSLTLSHPLQCFRHLGP